MSAAWNASMAKQRDAEDGGEVVPGEAVARHHVADIDGEADDATSATSMARTVPASTIGE